MYYFIYETTNTINGKKYRGAHSTNDMNDGYLGSGIAIKEAIRKYGKPNFIRETLCTCYSQEEMFDREAELVDQTWVSREDTYNMKVGGSGAPSGNAHHFFGRQVPLEQRERHSEFMKEYAKTRDQHGTKNPFYGKTHTPEARKAIAEAGRTRQITHELREHYSKVRKGKSNCPWLFEIELSTGEKEVVKDLTKWCEERNLTRHLLSKTLKTGKHHKGLRVIRKFK